MKSLVGYAVGEKYQISPPKEFTFGTLARLQNHRQNSWLHHCGSRDLWRNAFLRAWNSRCPLLDGCKECDCIAQGPGLQKNNRRRRRDSYRHDEVRVSVISRSMQMYQFPQCSVKGDPASFILTYVLLPFLPTVRDHLGYETVGEVHCVGMSNECNGETRLGNS
jgi:hypothetical protein